MMLLAEGNVSDLYTINSVAANEEGIRDFLFSLGCYPGEKITIVTKLASNYIVNIKDARFSIDEELAKLIMVENILNNHELEEVQTVEELI